MKSSLYYLLSPFEIIRTIKQLVLIFILDKITPKYKIKQNFFIECLYIRIDNCIDNIIENDKGTFLIYSMVLIDDFKNISNIQKIPKKYFEHGLLNFSSKMFSKIHKTSEKEFLTSFINQYKFLIEYVPDRYRDELKLIIS